MKRSFIILLFFLINLSATGLNQAQILLAKEAIGANPELLDVLESKDALKAKPLDITSKDSATIKHAKVENKIEFEKTDLNIDNNKKEISKKKRLSTLKRLSPLEYKTNEELLSEIKSIQLLQHEKKLQRFSSEFFKNKNKISKDHIAVSDDYIITKGDTLMFWIYGSTNRSFSLVVNNQGNINIPQIGPVHVAGEKFKDVKELLTNYLSSSYQNSEVVVDLNSFSTIQITLTGFVKAPGIYNTSSVSSIKDLLIEAKGVLDVGSVRNIHLKRNNKVIKRIDFYHLLSRGLDNGDEVLHPNDTIYIPKAYGLVEIRGAVNKEAIYEIKKGESLAKILRFAGGLKANADGFVIKVQRYIDNKKIKHFQLTKYNLNNFILKDGDKIYVERLSSLNEQYVTILGNVISEGKKALKSNMSLKELLNSQIKNGKLDSFFLPNTILNYAIIKRINPDLSIELFSIDLIAVLEGEDDFKLQNQDEIYIFNKLDISLNPFVTIEGKPLLKSGKFQYYNGLKLKDLINMAGVILPYDKQKVRVVSYPYGASKLKVSIVDMEKNPNFQLKAYDSVYLYSYLDTNPIDKVTIMGEVIKPGDYEIEDGMSLTEVIKSAGGLKESAYLLSCEIVRYRVKNGERVKKILNVSLDKADTFIVQKHDEINIKRVPGWSDRKTVTLKGEVKFPGTYVIHNGEKLSSVIKRAGGFTDNAFLYGAVFKRESVAKLQQEALKKSLSKLKEQIIITSLRAQSSKTSKPIDIANTIAAVETLIKEAQEVTPIGRVAINLVPDLEKFKNSYSDLTLKDKDELYIPTYNDTVLVYGEVLNPMALAYLGDNVREYIKKSGGLTKNADSDNIYIVHANGMAERVNLRSIFALAKVQKGDTIIVPKKLVFTSGFDLAQGIADIVYKISLTIAAAKTVGAL